MKQIVCEMCGGTDFIKQEGVFVCQICGTKYSIEEAKKMMIEGTVDVSGSTVKVDDTDKISNYMVMANNAYVSGNNQEAESYCNRIIELEPTHTEAWLLKGIVAAWQSTGAIIRIDEFITCFENAVSNVEDAEKLDEIGDRAYREFYQFALVMNKMKVDLLVSYPSQDEWKEYIYFPVKVEEWIMRVQLAYGVKYLEFHDAEEDNIQARSLSKSLNLDVHEEMDKQLVEGGISLWNKSLKEYQTSNEGYPTDYMLDTMMKNGTLAMLMLDYAIPKKNIEERIKNENVKKNVIKACENLIVMKTNWNDLKSYTYNFSNGTKSYVVNKTITLESKQKSINDIRKYHEIIKKCNPEYIVPVIDDPTQENLMEYLPKGCYVATAVYGSYDCPQVWTLRRYRDIELASTWYGRAFVHVYYAISPTIVKWFGDTEWFKRMWRGKLDRMVKNLQDKGYESTPYEDRDWR